MTNDLRYDNVAMEFRGPAGAILALDTCPVLLWRFARSVD